MKKTLILASIFAANASFATDIKPFVGAELGSSKAAVTVSSNGLSIGASDRGGHQTLKVGIIADNNHRLSAQYTMYNTESGVDLSSYGASYDYMIQTSSQLTPFIGLGVYIADYKESGLKALSSSFSKDTINLSGTQITANLGATYDLSTAFTLEAGYRIALSTSGNDSVYYGSTLIEAEFDDFNQFYVGVNYNF